IDVRADRVDRSVQTLRVPSARPDRVDERGIGDAAPARIDERLELLNVRMAIAPIPEHPCPRRSAAEGFGRGEVGNRERQRGEECDQECCQCATTRMRMISNSTIMMVVVEIVMVLAPPTSAALICRADAAARARVDESR